MTARTEVVVTGMGVVCPTGVGVEALGEALHQRRSAIGAITLCDLGDTPVHLAGEVHGFEPKNLVRPKKSLKIMSRSMQFGVAAAIEAWESARLADPDVDRDRVGVVFGADTICTPIDEAVFSYLGTIDDGDCDLSRWVARAHDTSNPLGMLKTLPNLVACHISIALDARGPNNTFHQGDNSSLLAIAEGVRLIERGTADCVIVGGASSLMDAYDWARSLVLDELSPSATPGTSPRPFDATRDGQVRGEGAGALVLESRTHAEARGAAIIARLRGYGAAFCPVANRADIAASPGQGMVLAMNQALRDAGLGPGDIGHVSAHGLGTLDGDRQEAAAIGRVFTDVPVTAPGSYFGNLAAAAGAVETIASVLAIRRGEVWVTLNHHRRDPTCPIRVVHEAPLTNTAPFALVANSTLCGQAAAIVVES